MHAQLLLSQSVPDKKAAREALAVGVKKCPQSVPLWLMSARLEEEVGVRIKARALLEKGRSLNPKSEELWLESVKVEERDGSGAHKAMLARGESVLKCHVHAVALLLTLSIDLRSPTSYACVWHSALLLCLARTAANTKVALG